MSSNTGAGAADYGKTAATASTNGGITNGNAATVAQQAQATPMTDAVSTAAALAATSGATPVAPKPPFVPPPPMHFFGGMLAAPPPPYLPVPQQQQTPPYFQNSKLRRGKWTQAEEDYATFLIQEFEKGTLQGCENGCTLRAFLSRKLHCAPMRISKKYAGKSIGKLVFLSKNKMGTVYENSTKLRDLECKFYKSLYEELQDGPPHFGAPFLSMSSGSVPPQPPYSMATAAGAAPPTYMPLPMQAAQQQQAGVQAPIGQPQPTTVNMLPGHPQAPTATVPQVHPPQASAAAAATSAAQQTFQLQQTYLNALNQMNANCGQSQAGPQPVLPAPTQAPASAPPTQNTAPAPFAAVQQVPPPTAVGQAQAQAPASQGPAVAPSPAFAGGAPTPVPNTNVPLPHPGAHLAGKTDSAPTADGSSDKPRTYSVDIPDFLSGFEKVAATKTSSGEKKEQLPSLLSHPLFAQSAAPLLGGDTAALAANGGMPLQCSPYLTSQSFDDLHRLLGSDLSPKPFDLNTSKPPPALPPPQQLPPAAPMNPGPVSADIYATFAQQSVNAVSQHSAYSRSDIAPSAPTSAPASSLIGAGNASVISAAVSNDGNSTSVVNHANLEALRQAKKPTVLTTAYPSSTTRNIVSGSERSSDVGSNEDGESGSSNNGSDNVFNDSDSSNSDEPQRKKLKTSHQQGGREEETVSPVSSDPSSPRAQ